LAPDDVGAQLREAEADVEFAVVRVPMTRPVEVARARTSASGSDLVVLTRGGGEGLLALEEDALIGAVASSPVPVAAALAHATDDLVLARVEDASFPTPGAFGARLRTALDAKWARRRKAAEAEALLRAGELGRLLALAGAARAALFWWRAAALVLALAAVAAWAAFSPVAALDPCSEERYRCPRMHLKNMHLHPLGYP
jgi:exodeoxyribonuclease VII large subunit